MTSRIDTSNIDSNFPVQGADNSSQGFRDNFSYIKIALDTAADEITNLKLYPVGVTAATSTSSGVVKVGQGLSIDETDSLSVTSVLPSYTVSSLSSITSPVAGLMVFVTDAPGGAQPCFFDGSNWFTMSNRTEI